jgi:hypothetical protein
LENYLVVVKKRQFKTAAKQQSGRLSGREVGAQIRVEKLAAEYVAQGASPDEARHGPVRNCAPTREKIGGSERTN